MDVKPGYKQTEVGVIPEDWEVRVLPDVCRFRGGKAHEQYISEAGNYVCVNSKFISTDGRVRKYSSANFCPAKRNDILMVMSDLPNGRALAKAYLVEEDDLYAVNQRVCALTAYCDCPEYLFYILNRNPYFLKFDDGVSQTHLLNHVFRECVLPIPPTMHEQRAIATALSDVDALIAKLDQLIAKKRDLKQAAMQELLTGRRRLPGFGGEWDAAPLGNLLIRLCNGLVYRQSHSGELRVTRIETIANGTIDLDRVGVIDFCEHCEPYRMQAGDILFSHINSLDHIGKVAMYDGKVPLYHGMNLLLLRSAESVNSKFLFYILTSSPTRRKVMSFAKQAVSQASINVGELSSVEILIPSTAEQTCIATVLSDMDAEITALEARRDKTKLLKQGMMQELLTGRIRLV